MTGRLSTGILFFLFTMILLSVKDGKVDIWPIPTFTIPVIVFQVFSILTFLVVAACFFLCLMGRINKKRASKLEAFLLSLLFLSRLRYMSVPVYIAAVLLVLINSLLLGVVNIPHDWLMIPFTLIGLILIGAFLYAHLHSISDFIKSQSDFRTG